MANRNYSAFPERKLAKPAEYSAKDGKPSGSGGKTAQGRPADTNPGYKAHGPAGPDLSRATPKFDKVKTAVASSYGTDGDETRYENDSDADD